jgi:hypothetical protein
MILPHDGLSSTVSTMAVQHHPVQSRKGEISMLDLPTPHLLPLETRRSLFPFTFISPLSPSFSSFLPDHTIKVLPLHSPELILAKKERVRSRFLKIRLLALISLDLSSPPNSAHDRL